MASTKSKIRSSRRRDTLNLFDWLNQLKAEPEVSPVDFKVAYEIGQHFNGGTAWPGLQTIASNIAIGKATVDRSVRRLCERGYLGIKPGSRGRGHSNHYYMVLPKGPVPKAHKRSTAVDLFEQNKRSAGDNKRSAAAGLNYLEPSKGTLSAFPIGERERSRALAVPASAPAPVGGALEQGKALTEDSFAELAGFLFERLWKFWTAARSWPDGAAEKAEARRLFIDACREAENIDSIDELIFAGAEAWVRAVEPRFLKKLSTWLFGRGWEKPPPQPKPKRNGGKVSLFETMLRTGGVLP